jgi:rhamnogalacturonyl hydrolase YesR
MKQVLGFHRILLEPEKNLYYHIWDEDRQAFERKLLWGVGNGWAAAGMARVLKALPETMVQEKAQLQTLIRNLLDGCLHWQREDGLFHDILDDPNTFVETNAAQAFAYTIYRGFQAGWLESRYLAAAEKIRLAVYDKVDEYGLVQGVCGAPNFNASGTATEGQAFFLLMEAAYGDLKAARTV